MREGEQHVTKRDLSSLKLLGLRRRADQPRSLAVVLASGRQGALPGRGHLVADRDGRHPDHAAARRHTLKPGSASRPFFGVEPIVLDDQGKPVPGRHVRQAVHHQAAGRESCARRTATTSASCRRTSATFKGMYFTGDGCRRDADGDYWLLGRVDDVINVSGHRLGTAEVESALGQPPVRGRSGRGRLPARHQGPGHLRLRDAEDGNRDHGRVEGPCWSSTSAKRSARSPRRT